MEEIYKFLYDTEDHTSRSHESVDASAFQDLFIVSEEGVKLKPGAKGKEVPLLSATVVILDLVSVERQKHGDTTYFVAELLTEVKEPSGEKILNHKTKKWTRLDAGEKVSLPLVLQP